MLAIIFMMVLDKLGKGLVLREIVALHTIFICLAMPTLGYTTYTRTSNFGFWVKYMPVTEETYFGFALPAIIAFSIALCWPLGREGKTDQGASLAAKVDLCRQILSRPAMKRVSLIILTTGVVMFFAMTVLPSALQFIFSLFYFTAFAGLLYVYYTPSFKYKWAILSLFVLFIFYNALRTGMFTVVAYMGITLFSFFFLGSKAGIARKLVFFLFGAFILIIIQVVKPEFRKSTWRQNYAGSKSELFFNLMTEQLAKESMFSMKAFYPIYYRVNQGYNVALVMRRIPEVQPYDGGKNLSLSFASAFVPRLLWPDKPEAGGKFNMKYYAGVSIKGWSTNVGPLGEAYGSFGKFGGILFMCLLGIFIRGVYLLVFVLSKKVPLLVFWLPVLFYQITYSAETDSLQIFNSLIKSAFFIWGVYKIMPQWFGLYKDRYIMKRRRKPTIQDQVNGAQVSTHPG
ncbi:O-antigen ligase [Paraflavitalea sp. CAU 1676]|nr:O-antigen ligase [Paraflavitalea sp. CAU 1676]